MISCDQGSRVAKTHMRSDNFRCRHSHVRHGLVCLFVNKNRLFLESLSRSQACAHIYMEGSSQEEVHSIKHTCSPAHSTKGKMRGHQPRKQVKCRFCGKTRNDQKNLAQRGVNYAATVIGVTISPSYARRKGGYMS